MVRRPEVGAWRSRSPTIRQARSRAAEQLVQLAVEQKVRSMKDELAALCAPGRDEDESTEARRTRLIRYQDYCERLAQSTAH